MSYTKLELKENTKKIKIFFPLFTFGIIFLIMSILPLSLQGGEPQCEVTKQNGEYVGTIKSNTSRIDDAFFKVKIPLLKPLSMDSFFNACFIFENKHPVPNTDIHYIGDDWNVTGKTDFAGCFSAKIASDSNFTIQAYNPLIKDHVELVGHILSAGKGELLDETEAKVIYDRIWKVTAEEGVTKFYPFHDGFEFVEFDRKAAKRSLVVSFPTEIGKKYVVSFKANGPLWVWFSNDSRKGSNPAKITGGYTNVITLDFLTATKKETRLYFQPKSDIRLKITELKIEGL